MLFLANAIKIDVSYSALSQAKPDIICYRKGELKLAWNQLIIRCIPFPLLLPVWTQLQSHAQPSDSYVLLAQNVTSSSNLLIITSLYTYVIGWILNVLPKFWTSNVPIFASSIQSSPHANVPSPFLVCSQVCMFLVCRVPWFSPASSSNCHAYLQPSAHWVRPSPL